MEKEIIRKYQLTQLNLIKEVDRIASLIGIKYYLIGGTLLGAVRHGGFIPWDTDIDIAMPRADYEAFSDYFETHDSEDFFLQNFESEKNHMSPHMVLKLKGTHLVFNKETKAFPLKYDGLFLDIFPLDEPPKEEKLQIKQSKKIKRIEKIIYYKAAYTYLGKTGAFQKLAKNIIRFALSPFTLSFLQRKLDKTMKMYNGCGSGYLVSMASHYSYKKQLMPKEVYGEPIRIKYEELMLLAPEKTEEYLTRLFKNYMELPPEDKRYSELDDILSVDFGKYEN